MSHALKIGRTSYYVVRKGTQQYCVVEGKRLQDVDFCWQLLKDSKSGRTFFINGTGVRRWHLPDIFLTDKERQEEERELNFRRERRKADAAKLQAQQQQQQQQQPGDGTAATGATGPPPSDPTAATEMIGEDDEQVGDIAAAAEGAGGMYAKRDKRAQKLKLLPAWEKIETRKEVVKFIKSVLQPLFTQGDLTEKLFLQIVATSTREFCSKTSVLGDAEKAVLRRDVLDHAQGRLREMHRKEDFEKMNEDLLEKVKRLDTELRKTHSNVEILQKNEERMKDELFHLRAHKQDVLLGSFKRLTRAGLITAYWERWIRYKNVTEAQLHVKARERRALTMTDKISELEEALKQSKIQHEQLKNRLQMMQGRDVVATMLKQAGAATLKRFFRLWNLYATEAQRLKELANLQKQIENCPHCALRAIEMERSNARLARIIQESEVRAARVLTIDEERKRLAIQHDEAVVLCGKLQQQFAESRALPKVLSEQILELKSEREDLLATIKMLREEVDRTRFEAQDFSRNPAGDPRNHRIRLNAETSIGAASSLSNASGPAQPPPPPPGQSVPSHLGLSSFFAAEADRGGDGLGRLMHRRTTPKDVRMEQFGSAAATRGLVDQAVENSIAPAVYEPTKWQSEVQLRNYPSPPPPPLPSPPAQSMERNTDPSSSDSDDDDGDEEEENGRSRLSRRAGSSGSPRRRPPLPGSPTQPAEGQQQQQRTNGLKTKDASSSSLGIVEKSGMLAGLHLGPTDPGTAQHFNIHELHDPTRTVDKRVSDASRCSLCGFKKTIAPFCPRDGSRHIFSSFAPQPQQQQQPSMFRKQVDTSGIGTAFQRHLTPNFDLQSAAFAATSKQGEAEMLLALPTHLTLSNKPLHSVDPMRFLGLPTENNAHQQHRDQYPRQPLKNNQRDQPTQQSQQQQQTTTGTRAAVYTSDPAYFREVVDYMRDTRVNCFAEKQRMENRANHAGRGALAPGGKVAPPPTAPGSTRFETNDSEHSVLSIQTRLFSVENPSLVTTTKSDTTMAQNGAAGGTPTTTGSRWLRLHEAGDAEVGRLMGF